MLIDNGRCSVVDDEVHAFTIRSRMLMARIGTNEVSQLVVAVYFSQLQVTIFSHFKVAANVSQPRVALDFGNLKYSKTIQLECEVRKSAQ